jgi:type I restriction enzyme, S subunit
MTLSVAPKGTNNFPMHALKRLVALCNQRTTDRPADRPYVGLENVESWTGRLLPQEIDVPTVSADDEEDRSTVGMFERGDVLFGKLRPYLAKVFVADSPGICSTELLVMRPAPVILPEFLKYVMLDAEFIRAVDATTFGARMPRAEWSAIGDVRVVVPPIPEQHNFVTYLERETGKIDSMIRAKRRLLGLLDEKRSAVITHAVSRGLNVKAPLKESGVQWIGKVPAHWRLARLRFLAAVRTGLTVGQKYADRELVERPYLRVANVQDGYLDLTEIKTVEVSQSDAEGTLLKAGDVLMNEGGDIDKLGRGCVWHGEIKDCLHQNHVFAVRPHSIDPEWLAMWTASAPSKSYFQNRAKRTTNLASISGTNIKELPVLLPPVEEQTAILAAIATANRTVDALIEATTKSVALLWSRRSSIIAEAVKGRLPLRGVA